MPEELARPQGERLAVVETIVGRVETRLEQLAERSYSQGNALAVMSGNIDDIIISSGRIETLIKKYRTESSEAHAILRNELSPIREDYMSRLAIQASRDRDAEINERRHRIKDPWFTAILGLVVSALTVAVSWYAWKFGWGPHP